MPFFSDRLFKTPAWRLLGSVAALLLCAGCVTIAEQVTPSSGIPPDQGRIVGRLIGEEPRSWLPTPSVKGIYFHRFDSVDDIPTTFVGLADHIRADTKNEQGIFVVDLPAGTWYVSGFHYKNTHVEMSRNYFAENTGYVPVITVKAGVASYIGTFYVSQWRPAKYGRIKQQTLFRDDFDGLPALLNEAYPDFSMPVEKALASAVAVEK